MRGERRYHAYRTLERVMERGYLEAMASNDVVHFKDSTFQAEVLKSELPVLVDFWAVWCGPCKAIAPIVDELATLYKGKVKIGKIDVDHEQQTAQQFGIRSIPTLLVFKGGRVVDTIIGAAPKSKIEESLKKAMG
jgi:thioredoxin 1